MKRWMMAAILAGGLRACNNEADSVETDEDRTQVADSGSTPGANTVLNDTLTMGSGAGVDSAQLDTLDRNNNR